MVAVTLCGLRRSRSTPCGSLAGVDASGENEVISSMSVGLVTGQAVDAALAHPNATAHQRRRRAVCCGSAACHGRGYH
jgi:hypothetical protein